ncbi:hypothetical protein TNCV_3659061 [Trichonephila clavipes]|nr:hypothetical protein TNCV_3659061 [Trichonephila clavipes]
MIPYQTMKPSVELTLAGRLHYPGSCHTLSRWSFLLKRIRDSSEYSTPCYRWISGDNANTKAGVKPCAQYLRAFHTSQLLPHVTEADSRELVLNINRLGLFTSCNVVSN